MSLFNAYDIADMVVCEASERFGKSISEASKTRLKNSCDLIDKLIPEYDCESTEFAVDEDTMNLKVSLIFPDMTMGRDGARTFIDAIGDMSEISFSVSDGNLQVNLIMHGLWRNTD